MKDSILSQISELNQEDKSRLYKVIEVFLLVAMNSIYFPEPLLKCFLKNTTYTIFPIDFSTISASAYSIDCQLYNDINSILVALLYFGATCISQAYFKPVINAEL